MDLGIAGKVAFVSGGSMGMGRTTAELFAREGCRVVVAALPEHKESIDETVGAIQASGGEAVGVAADLTKEDDVDRAVATAEQALQDPHVAEERAIKKAGDECGLAFLERQAKRLQVPPVPAIPGSGQRLEGLADVGGRQVAEDLDQLEAD